MCSLCALPSEQIVYYYFVHLVTCIYSYVNASLWKYMEKHKVKQDSRAFQLVRIEIHLDVHECFCCGEESTHVLSLLITGLNFPLHIIIICF